MPHDVTMPQLGMAQDAGRLTQWLKAPGDAVTKGDALFEVETDKATMEVEAQASGFLTHVTAAEGEDVPVGHAIARISDSADAAGDSPAPNDSAAPDSAPQDTLPDGHQVTMPQLGMAQDSGVLVIWHKALGDAVATDDILFEVETDKSTVEVPAGHSGYLAATLAEPGDEVPVGAALAIISAQKPDAPVARGVAAAAPAANPAPAETVAPKPAPPMQATAHQAAPQTGGRILASPKLRRVALEQGLDLARLVRAGHPQPFHMRDLEVLEALPTQTPAPQAGGTVQALRLQAACAQDGFSPFATWAADAHGLQDADALLAGLAGASLGRAATVAVERFGASRVYDVAAGRGLSAVTDTENAPDLRVRDLRATSLRAVSLGAEDVPVLSIIQQGAGLALVLECSAAQMDGPAAIALISEFAGRMEQPLRHLL
ncbi:MAG: pyruvate dehydrogenase [Rhodobacteraceae bacterium]|nr:pyruvate dehydrogenase [Paracoccaceae bacterium]